MGSGVVEGGFIRIMKPPDMAVRSPEITWKSCPSSENLSTHRNRAAVKKIMRAERSLMIGSRRVDGAIAAFGASGMRGSTPPFLSKLVMNLPNLILTRMRGVWIRPYVCRGTCSLKRREFM